MSLKHTTDDIVFGDVRCSLLLTPSVLRRSRVYLVITVIGSVLSLAFGWWRLSAILKTT